jgi:hypothetical protein
MTLFWSVFQTNFLCFVFRKTSPSNWGANSHLKEQKWRLNESVNEFLIKQQTLLICSKAVMSFVGRRIKRINDKMFLKIAIFLRWGITVSASKIMTEKFRGRIQIKNTYLMSRNYLIIELKLCQKLTLVPIVLLVWNNF